MQILNSLSQNYDENTIFNSLFKAKRQVILILKITVQVTGVICP